MVSTFTKALRTWQPALLGGLLLAAVGAPLSASAQRVLWADDAQSPAAARQAMAKLRQYRPVTVQLDAMRSALAPAPAEQGAGARNSTTVVSLPLPDGTSQRFRVVETPVMAPELAARYPMIKTYAAQGVDNPAATARLDVTPAGFHAMISQSGRTVYIDPTTNGDTEHYLVFDKQAMVQKGFVCLNTDAQDVNVPQPSSLQRVPNGTQLRTYRLALACSGEYAVAVCRPATPTKELTLAKMVTSVNRVDGVYEQEVAVRLTLIANNDRLIYLDGTTDPYSNTNPSALLTENIANCNAVVGFPNYDIGHVFTTGGGGVAYKPCVCLTNKAGGETGLSNPVGDAYDIDYVAHEMGHQFGGDHTFNSNSGNCAGGNRAASSAYEPGSGVSIMAYAGICAPQDLDPHSIPYFHSRSIDQIVAHITGAGNCGVVTATNNGVPVVNAGANYVIPFKTPFTLTGSATDPNSDALTYSWEQYNLGPTGDPRTPTGDAAIFRMFAPTALPSRTFPKIYNLITNTDTIGEQLPTYARKLIFRLVARDNRVNGGAVDYDSMNVAVVATAGPFLVTYPNTSGSSISWLAGTPQQVTWDVANTTAAPINAANVDILLSTDGGRTYPTTLLANTPNDGSQTITLPATQASSSTARIKVKASGNVFFDISNQDFSIRAVTAPTFFLTPSTASGDVPSLCSGTTATINVAVGQLQGFTGAVTLSAANLPTGLSVVYTNATVNAGASTQATITASAAVPAGTYIVNLVGTSGAVTQSQPLQIVVRQGATATAVPVSPSGSARTTTRPRLTWNAVANADTYEVQIATDPAFAVIVQTQGNISGTSYTPSVTLQPNTIYYWRVRAVSVCGSAPFSAGTQFRTGIQSCTTIVATQVPKVILPSVNTVTSVITVANTDRVSDVRIRNLAITHPDVSELEISLTNPAGRKVVLLSRVCPGTTSLNLSFDDAAAAALSCPLTGGGTYRPANPLADLINDQANGNWTLSITDNVAGNGGTLTGWSLELCTVGDVPTPPSSLTILPGTFSNGNTENLLIWLDNSGNETRFEVERAFGTPTNYAAIGTTAANETSFSDRVTASGRYYYRVRACNAVGCSEYASEATILANRNTELLKGIEVYPNPSNGIFKVNVDNGQKGNITLRVTDALGRTVATETVVKGAGALQHQLDLSKLATGVYQLHVDLPNGTAVTRLLKQ